MILRRIAAAFRKQDWFTVFVETMIVVLGVFLGLQVNNWNEAHSDKELEHGYLVRLAADLELTLTSFENSVDQHEMRKSLSAALITATSHSATEDAVLIESTQQFFEIGWSTPYFQPIDTTFQDLSSTGNLQLIRDTDLRNAVIALYDNYEETAVKFFINQNWALPNDARISYEHDILRWGLRYNGIYPDQSDEEKLSAIRGYREEIGRLAALYFWLFDHSIANHEAAIAETDAVLGLIRQALNADARGSD